MATVLRQFLGKFYSERDLSSARSCSAASSPDDFVKPENDARQSARCEPAFATGDLPRRKSSEVISDPVPANQPRSARIHPWRRDARRRVPSDPWARGGTVSALRLVTCCSSDALRLSSSGRTSRQSAAESSCSLRFPCAFLLPWPEFPEIPGAELVTEPSSAPSVKRERLSAGSTTPSTTCA